jgi:hypothetical protein
MKYSYSLLFIFLFPLFAMAQQPTGDLTIFSEDGDKFFLILNGQRQNNAAQTNVRIEDLNQPYYSAKIIFEDKGLGEISKNIAIADPSTNAMMDVTYKIKKDGSGKTKLRYFSAIPPVQNYVAPADVYVMHYGGAPASSTVTEQTTTTTTGTTGTMGANVNVNGVNVGVSINDPYANGTVTQTTTTTTTTTTNGYSEQSHSEEHHHSGYHKAGGDCYPMNSNDFEAAKKTIADATYAETMLSTAKSIIASNCLSAEQVVQICNIFSFEDSKLEFAKAAYSRTTDRNNYFKVVNAFTYSSSKDDLNAFISSH